MKDPWRIAMICVTLGLAIALWQAVIYRPPVAGNLMTDAQIAEDASGEMTLPQMQRARFQPTTLPVTLGYTPSAFWFRLSIAPGRR
ncbi:7TM-DISM domain-containing protein [Gemmobacter lanyuensis]